MSNKPMKLLCGARSPQGHFYCDRLKNHGGPHKGTRMNTLEWENKE